MAGNGEAMYPDGFYTSVNSNGLKDNTNAIVVQTGYSFSRGKTYMHAAGLITYC